MPKKKESKEKEKEKEEENVGKKTEEKQEEKEKKQEREKLLVPLEDYIKVAIHLGTRAVTPGMRMYVYRRKADGIAVLNTKKIDEKIAIAADFLAQYEPREIMLCCRRDAGIKALKAFGEATGIRTFARYPPGIITNPDLENFFEPAVVFITDPWLDKNALLDSVKINVPIVALCDTNNVIDYVDLVVPCNNKAPKSIGLVFYIIAKLYLKKRGIKKKLKRDDFYEFEETEERKSKEKDKKREKVRELITRKMKMKNETKTTKKKK